MYKMMILKRIILLLLHKHIICLLCESIQQNNQYKESNQNTNILS